MRKMGYFIVFVLFLFSVALADEAKFGQYNYTNYNTLNKQLQYNRMQRARAIQRQRYYRQNPARNIIIPRQAGYYPNIERYPQRQNQMYKRYGYY